MGSLRDRFRGRFEVVLRSLGSFVVALREPARSEVALRPVFRCGAPLAK